jgi:hypothetical protein
MFGCCGCIDWIVSDSDKENDFAQIRKDVRTTSCTVGTVPVSSMVNHSEAHQLPPYSDGIKNITFSAVYIFLSLYLGTRKVSSISWLNQT